MRRAVLALWVPVAAWCGAALALDAWGGAQAPAAHAELVAVAGCHVDPDGQPSPCLDERVRAGVALVRAGRAPRLLLTGGVGDRPPAEAEAAAVLAVSLGVPAEAIVVEALSTSTEENAAFGMALAPVGSVIVVTDTFHLWRAERCFGHYAQVSGQGVTPLSQGRRAWGALREVMAVGWYVISGRCAGGSHA